MRHRAARFVSLLFATLFFLSILIPVASAADFKGKITLEGEETFSLTASELRLFDFENIAPGDVRNGKLQIKNATDKKMECQVLSIMSYSKDKRLFDAMTLRILDEDGTVLYTGPYGGNDSEPLASITVKAKKERELALEVSFPSDQGNAYQATEMDSIWTFEARVFDTSTPSDSDNKDDDHNNGGTKDDSKKDNDNKGNNNGSGDENNDDSGGDRGSSEQGSGGSNGAGAGSGSNANDDGKGRSGVRTGLDLTLSESGFIVGLVLVGMCLLAAVVTSVRIWTAKHKRKNKDRE